MLDDFNREALAIEIDTSLPSERLVRVFEHLKQERGLPDVLRTDNGPEFLGEVLNTWLFRNLDEVREITWAWMLEYNEERDHDGLGGLTPTEVLATPGSLL